MFGKNSAGKSTVVQALHYAREVLLHNTPNADRTALGGSSIDLGGFQNILHRASGDKAPELRYSYQPIPQSRKGTSDGQKRSRKIPAPELMDENSKPIILRFGFTIDELPRYRDFERDTYFIERLEAEEDERNQRAIELLQVHRGKSLEESMAFLSDAADDPDAYTGAVEIKIEWSRYKKKPLVTRYTTWLAGEEAGQITTAVDEASFNYQINLNHRLLLEPGQELLDRKPEDALWHSDFLLDYKHPLPVWGELIAVEPEGFLNELLIGDQTATEMLVAPGEILVDLLKGLRYIGPLRETPPRISTR